MPSTATRLVVCSMMVAASFIVGGAFGQPSGPRFVREISWQGRGVWLKADTHVHTRFSDGKHQLPEVLAKSEVHGCDVVAVTDHLDDNLKGATAEYFASIVAARKAHPAMTILSGGEWNVPPWGGDEHATVLVSPAVESRLTEFKRLFDDY